MVMYYIKVICLHFGYMHYINYGYIYWIIMVCKYSTIILWLSYFINLYYIILYYISKNGWYLFYWTTTKSNRLFSYIFINVDHIQWYYIHILLVNENSYILVDHVPGRKIQF
jgi:hypothetical protein